MTVQQLRDNASSWELSEWMAFERYEVEAKDEAERHRQANRGLAGLQEE